MPRGEFCRYYDGVGWGRPSCAAGVPWDSVRLSPDSALIRQEGWQERLPCFDTPASRAIPCELRSFKTPEERATEAQEVNDVIDRHLKYIAESRCIECELVTTMRQVGPYVYGACGHCQYQGRLA